MLPSCAWVDCRLMPDGNIRTEFAIKHIRFASLCNRSAVARSGLCGNCNCRPQKHVREIANDPEPLRLLPSQSSYAITVTPLVAHKRRYQSM